MAKTTRIGKYDFKAAWLELAKRNRLGLKPNHLSPAVVAFHETAAGKVDPVVAFFRHKDGSLVELPASSNEVHVNLGEITERPNWHAFAVPKVGMLRAKSALGKSWTNARAFHVLMAAPTGFGLAARHPVWVCVAAKGHESRLVLVSGLSGEALLLAPLRLPHWAPNHITIKVIILLVVALGLWFFGSSGWGSAAAALAIAIAVAILGPARPSLSARVRPEILDRNWTNGRNQATQYRISL
jgi:hypothetical protein